MPGRVLQIRLPEEIHSWIMGNGGSPRAREVLEREFLKENGGPAGRSAPAEQTPSIPVPVKAASAEPADKSEELCPRWMHHRKNIFCKTCGKTP